MTDESNAIWERARANWRTLCACPRHRFTIDLSPDRKIGKRWKCAECGGEVDHAAKHWYELGLRHA